MDTLLITHIDVENPAFADGFPGVSPLFFRVYVYPTAISWEEFHHQISRQGTTPAMSSSIDLKAWLQLVICWLTSFNSIDFDKQTFAQPFLIEVFLGRFWDIILIFGFLVCCDAPRYTSGVCADQRLLARLGWKHSMGRSGIHEG